MVNPKGTRRKPLLTWETDWPKAEARFWSKVDRTETCWLWTGTVLAKGYGQFSLRGRLLRAHRVAYLVLVGPIPDGMQVEHRCRVRRCVNPRHLRLATNKQNSENREAERGNRSRVRGVSWYPPLQKWRAQVVHNGERHFLGYHEDLEDARRCVVAKRNELYTHNDIDLPLLIAGIL